VVARPTTPVVHDYGREWDYSDFARSAGQTVYRWKINELLNQSEVALNLADVGSDIGHLVHTPETLATSSWSERYSHQSPGLATGSAMQSRGSAAVTQPLLFKRRQLEP